MSRAIVTAGLAIYSVLICFSTAQPQDKRLIVRANARIRYEIQDSFNQKYYGPEPAKGSTDDGFVLGRFQAGFDYRPVKGVLLALQELPDEPVDPL